MRYELEQIQRFIAYAEILDYSKIYLYCIILYLHVYRNTLIPETSNDRYFVSAHGRKCRKPTGLVLWAKLYATHRLKPPWRRLGLGRLERITLTIQDASYNDIIDVTIFTVEAETALHLIPCIPARRRRGSRNRSIGVGGDGAVGCAGERFVEIVIRRSYSVGVDAISPLLLSGESGDDHFIVVKVPVDVVVAAAVLSETEKVAGVIRAIAGGDEDVDDQQVASDQR